MATAYRALSLPDTLFAAADAQYSAIKSLLAAGDLAAVSQADVERRLAVEQRELMRRLLESHLAFRGQEVVAAPVIGSDGIARTHVRRGKVRHLETTFGTVAVERTGYAGRELPALFPVDAALNLPERRYSLEVERQVALLAPRVSFDATVDLLHELSGARVPKRQAEEIVQRSSADFDEFYASTRLDPTAETSELLILTLDQKGVVLLPEDLTPETRKLAEVSRHRMATRLSRGEKAGRKRMATVAAVYTVAPHGRSAEEVVAGLRHVRDAAPRPRPPAEGKRVWASLERPAEEVVRDLFAEAMSRDPEGRKRWLVLIDGDRKLERWVRAEARRCGVQVTLILDFIHALEYLWRAGHAFFAEGTAELEAWVLERLLRILKGQVSQVVAGMTRMATRRGLTPKERAPVDKAAKYMLARKDMMRYDDLLGLGAPIASGVIEGACRHLINDRLDVTGARWGIRSAEAILRLRSLIASGDFDDYWRFHEEAEAFRTHNSRYADAIPPGTVRPPPGPQLRLVRAVD